MALISISLGNFLAQTTRGRLQRSGANHWQIGVVFTGTPSLATRQRDPLLQVVSFQLWVLTEEGKHRCCLVKPHRIHVISMGLTLLVMDMFIALPQSRWITKEYEEQNLDISKVKLPMSVTGVGTHRCPGRRLRMSHSQYHGTSVWSHDKLIAVRHRCTYAF